MTGQPQVTLPVPRTCPFAPPPEYEQLREQAPVARLAMASGRPAWVLTRHEDIRAVLSDPRFSSDRSHPSFPAPRVGDDLASGFKFSLISMDPPEHGPARRGVAGEFTARRMLALRPRVQQIVDEHVDAMLAGPRPADLVQALALPVPSLVICELLGIPYADHGFFQARSTVLLRGATPPGERVQAGIDLLTYLDELVTRRERHPAGDLISRQLAAGSIEHGDLVSLALLLLVAGHETTANMISLSALALIRDPAAARNIRADPARTPGAVEELLRYFTITDLTLFRVALADIEVGGQLIRAGEPVISLVLAGNHDPAAFPDPGRLDIGRDARPHLAFGFGPHQCLGQSLARMELQVVLDTLVRRVPDLELAVPLGDLPFKDDTFVYGAYQLPVTWSAG
ncbi:MAG TPA: cytochrome P450 [Streptosporangiaceae bacterium]